MRLSRDSDPNDERHESEEDEDRVGEEDYEDDDTDDVDNELHGNDSDDNQLEVVGISLSEIRDVPNYVDKAQVKFFLDNFKKRVCKRFVRNQEDQRIDHCYCGYPDTHHPEPRDSVNQNQSWHPLKDTITLPTDAFGEIYFGGKTNSKFVRADVNTDLSKLVALLVKEWDIPKPKLIISVKGANANFDFKKELKQVFCQGLTTSAKSTNAWIITDGMYKGATKEVGDAIKYFGIRYGRKHQLVTIGIAPWGCINNREILVNPNGFGHWPVHYIVPPDAARVNETQLDRNHSHFIFIDDGTQHKWGHEKPIRGDLEILIANLPSSGESREHQEVDHDDYVVIPRVSIVLGGELETLRDVMKDIDNGVSVIIIEGSGGMADILAYAYNNCKFTHVKIADDFDKSQKRTIVLYQQMNLDRVEKMIRYQFNLSDASEYREMVRYCIEQYNLLSVFKAEAKSTLGDIDEIILKAILKTNQGKRIDQLKLALALNRVDIAKNEIYTEDAEFEVEELHDLLFTALVDDNVDFVKLLIDKGVTLNQFVTVRRLLQLYNDPVTLKQNAELDKMAKESDLISLKHVGKIIFKFMGEYYHPMYLKSPYKDVDPHMYISVSKKRKRPWAIALLHKIKKTKAFKKGMKKLRPGRYISRTENNITFEDPAKELFIWCILICRTQMSLLFWERGYNAMALALTAHHISSGLLSSQEDSDMMVPLQDQGQTFEKLAVEVLNECYETDQRRATLLLVTPYKDYDDATLLEMAVQAGNELFISHFTVQKFLTNIWIGNISDENSYIRVLFALALPMFAPYILKYRNVNLEEIVFQKKDEAANDDRASNQDQSQYVVKKTLTASLTDKNTSVQSQNSLNKSKLESTTSKESLRKKQGPSGSSGCLRTYRDRFVYFFDAPVTKFSYHCLSHFGFLILFGFIFLTDFYPKTNWKEMLLTTWVATLVLEEIRQLVMGSGASWKLKFSNYMTDMWNIMDLLSLALYISALVLRFIPTYICLYCFYSSRIVFAFSLMMHFLRVLRFFSIHQELGPFMVMIRKTVIHLAYFFAIVIVFVVAYGISTQVMLFPNYPISYHTFRDVILSPWFKVLQQSYDYDISTGDACRSVDSRDSADACAADGRPPHECLGRPEQCPAIIWLVPIITAFYTLITNVMMLNLLIAMISDTFAEVSSKTSLVWCTQRYQLIQEYELRPNLPPPFIIFNHLYLIFKCITPNILLPEPKIKFSFTMPVASLVRRELKHWEVLQAERYIRSVKCDEDEAIEKKIKDTSDIMDTISLQIGQFSRNSIMASQVQNQMINPSFPPVLNERLNHIEKHLETSSQTLFWLINQFTSDKEKVDAVCYSLDDLREQQKRSNHKMIEERKQVNQKEFLKLINFHKKSRTFVYANFSNKRVFRCVVPDAKVPFEVEFPEYKPKAFTDDSVLKGAYNDVDIMSNPAINLFFNEHRHVNRISDMGEYRVVQGLPINPMGRTGLRGRGVLSRWGPNRVLKAVLTRWEDKSTTEGLKRLQFLSVEAPLGSTTSFIPEYLNPHDHMPVYECLYPAMVNVLDQKAMMWLRNNEKHVYQGYLDDPRNTDNAWLEVMSMTYHDSDNTLTTEGDVNQEHGFKFKFSDSEKFTWKRISTNLEAYGDDLLILYKVAKMHDAVF